MRRSIERTYCHIIHRYIDNTGLIQTADPLFYKNTTRMDDERHFLEQQVDGITDLANAVTTERLLRKLDRCFFFRLRLTGVRTLEWLQRLNLCNYTRVLIFIDCNVTPDDFVTVVQIFPRIEEIYMENTTPEVSSLLVEKIITWESLKLISLRSEEALNTLCNEATYVDTNRLLNILTYYSRHLDALYIDNRGISDDSFARFAERYGPYLKHLAISAEYLSKFSYRWLSSYAQLSVLEIEHALNMTDDDLLTILHMQHLKKLRIANGLRLFSDNFMPSFKNFIFPQLREFDITACKQLDDIALYFLIRCCPHLDILELDSLNAITNQGLLRIVRFCSFLRKWSIHECPRTTADCVQHLINKFIGHQMEVPHTFEYD